MKHWPLMAMVVVVMLFVTRRNGLGDRHVGRCGDSKPVVRHLVHILLILEFF